MGNINYIDPMTLDPELLQAFQAVIECGGFTRAAERLHRTQSAISMQIKRLEQRLECRLLEREAGNISLTTDGERLLERSRRLLAMNDEIIAEFKGVKPAGHVRIGTPVDYTTTYLGDLLSFLMRCFPGVTAKLESGLSLELMSRLQQGGLDMAIVTEMPGFTGGSTLSRTQMTWVCARGATAPARTPLPLAIFPPGCHLREEALRALDAGGLDYRIVYESPSVQGIEAAVHADFAVSALALGTFSTRLVVANNSGLPALPEVSMALYTSADAREPVNSLADFLLRNLSSAAAPSP
jgi:DNA-binding transcriptional LysR family regulator